MNTTNRRDFLRLAALGAGGAILPSAALPAAEETVPPAFSSGKAWISLAYQHIHIGLVQPFSVLHISDTHLALCHPHEPPHKVEFARKRNIGFGTRQVESLRNSLAWAAKNTDYVIHTGDLIDFQTEANLEMVRKLFGEEKSMVAAMGNHEYQRRMPNEPIRNTTEYNDMSSKLLSSAFPFDISLQSTIVNGVNFVTLDQVYGFVTAKQVERFAAEVKKGLPIILCMHVPIYTEHVLRIYERYWRNRHKKFRLVAPPRACGDSKRQQEDPVTRDFIAYLKSEPLLKGILAGHLHIDIQDRFSPTAVQYIVGGNFLFHGEELLFT